MQRLPLVGRDVGRVRDDEIPAFGRGLQVAFSNFDLQVEPFRVLAGERDCLRRGIDRNHMGVGTLVRNRERDCARARAEVEHARLELVTEQGEAALHDDLRLRARDERTRVCVQHQPSETPLSQHVRQRLALPATFEQHVELVRDVLVAPLVHARAGGSKKVREEKLRVDARRVDTCLREPLLCDAQGFRDGHCSSARRRSSAPSASVNSSSSPCRILSS